MIHAVLPALIAAAQIVGAHEVVEGDDEDVGSVAGRAAAWRTAQALRPENLPLGGVETIQVAIRRTRVDATVRHERRFGSAAERLLPDLFAIGELQCHNPGIVQCDEQFVVAGARPDGRGADVALPDTRAVGRAKGHDGTG